MSRHSSRATTRSRFLARFECSAQSPLQFVPALHLNARSLFPLYCQEFAFLINLPDRCLQS
jgi:hypothetical protein